MSIKPNARIDQIKVTAATIPTSSPESDGTLAWNHTTVVLVEIACDGVTGLGYTYADVSTATLIESLLKGVLEGRDAMDISALWMEMVLTIRNLGRPGIASMAISAVDVALWDLKSKLLRLPLVKLLGAVRPSIAVYGSGGFTSYSDDQLQRQLSQWVESGMRMVKMKVGREPKRDVQRVTCARKAIGDEAELFVDANGAYERKQALALAFKFQESGVTWFEEPVSSDDLEGLRLLRDRAPVGISIAAGEYGYDAYYFRRMLDSGSVDVLQADATRCGGITGFLQADSLCAAHNVPLSAHTAPAIHMHVCCAAARSIHLEYFHDHSRIEKMIFEGAVSPLNGNLAPDLSRWGLGLEVRRDELSRYRVN
ncbi:MAG: enolase C-terminal domain-like protein [Terriglobales bacterium]